MKPRSFVIAVFLGIAQIYSASGLEHEQILNEFFAKNVRPNTGVCRGFGHTALQVLVHRLSMDAELQGEFQLSNDQLERIQKLDSNLAPIQDIELNRVLSSLRSEQKSLALMVCLLIDGATVLENAELSSVLRIGSETRTKIEQIRKDMNRDSIGPLFSSNFVSSTDAQRDMKLGWTVSLNVLFSLRVVGKLSDEEKALLAEFIKTFDENKEARKARDQLLNAFYRPSIGLTYDIE